MFLASWRNKAARIFQNKKRKQTQQSQAILESKIAMADNEKDKYKALTFTFREFNGRKKLRGGSEPVWKHFLHSADWHSVKRKFDDDGKVLKAAEGSTTGILRHLKANHKILMQQRPIKFS